MGGVASRLHQGPGWRWGWNGERGLLGADDWAVELTAAEWQDWCRLCALIWETWQAMQAHLMPEEDLTVEQRTDLLTLILSGSPTQVTLYLQLHSGRLAEGQWQGTVAHTLLGQMAELQGSRTL